MTRDVTDPTVNDDKATPVDADRILWIDSETAPDSLKEITGTTLKAYLKTYFDTLYATGSATFWTAVPGTPVRASNTTFTVTGDYSSVTTYPFGKCMIYKWTESSVVKVAMQSIPQTYGAPNTTFTIIGDTMASIDSGSLKYAMIGAEAFAWNFGKAGAVAATETDAFNEHTALQPYRVLGADLWTPSAGTTNNTTIDPNKSGTTMFTTKPTLATTVASSPTPFTADSGTSLAIGDKVTGDVDAVQTTAAIDLYWKLYIFPTRYLYLT